MARYSSIIACGIIVSASLFLFACNKKVEEPQQNEVAATTQTANNCKATVHAMLVQRYSTKTWHTLMQRWYGNDGKIAYLKAYLNWVPELYETFIVNLDWGQMTYEGDQVYLKDVLRNKMLMRVTVDDQGRPAASYFDFNEPFQLPYKDTSYYYFTGSRLDSILSITKHENFAASFSKTKFYYDAYSNLIRIGDVGSRMVLKYDYSKPAADGMITSYQFTLHHKLMEYMDLLHFPSQHRLVSAVLGQYPSPGYPDDIYPIMDWNYHSYVINNNLVSSYTNGITYTRQYFTGWECNTTPANNDAIRQNTSINSLEDFQRRFPITK
jgi:hypothetical protein